MHRPRWLVVAQQAGSRFNSIFLHQDYRAMVCRPAHVSLEMAWCLTVGRRVESGPNRFIAFKEYFGKEPNNRSLRVVLRNPPLTRSTKPADRCWLMSFDSRVRDATSVNRRGWNAKSFADDGRCSAEPLHTPPEPPKDVVGAFVFKIARKREERSVYVIDGT